METKNGRPYLLEVVVGKVGAGAESDWYHKHSIAALQATDV